MHSKTFKMKSVQAFLLIIASTLPQIRAQGLEYSCNPSTGPAGPTLCVNLKPDYSKVQWATCLSNIYIKRKSGGRHHCQEESPYCWYQCMIETYDVEEGPVYGSCGCGGHRQVGSTDKTPAYITTPLPPRCASPSGSDCSWYRECLKAKINCEGTEDTYAITYAEKFCDLYTNHQTRFSGGGQQWVDAVRRCLQVALVPFIRFYANPTCKEIKDAAFASHTPCYLKPFEGTPSLCELPARDFWQVFVTISSALESELYESLKGAIKTAFGCGKRVVANTADPAIRYLQLTIEGLDFQRGKREVTGEEKVLTAIGDAFAQSVELRKQNVQWFSLKSSELNMYHAKPLGEGDFTYVTMIIADRSQIDLDFKSSSPALDMDATTKDIIQAVQDRKLDPSSPRPRVAYVEGCEDAACARSIANATNPRQDLLTTSDAASLRIMLSPTAFIWIVLLLVNGA